MRSKDLLEAIQLNIMNEPTLELTPKEADDRGQNSEERVLTWLSNQELFPWVQAVEPTKKWNPSFDIILKLDTTHPVSKIIRPPSPVLPVDIKSSQIGLFEYYHHKKKNFSPDYWLQQWWIVINAGPHISDEKVASQLVLWLLVFSRRYDTPRKWHRLLDQLHPFLVDSFKNHLFKTKAYSLPIIKYLSRDYGIN